MPLPVDAQSSLLPVRLPDDPEPGQIFRLPKEQSVGGAVVLTLRHQRTLVGTVNRLLPIPNVTKMYRAERVTSSVELPRNTLVRIVALQFSFDQLTFFQNFGWIGTQTAKKTLTLSDKFYKVIEVIPVGPAGPNFHLYEQLCLSVINPKQGD